MALSVGVADPIAFLAQTGTDWDIAVAVVQKAQDLQMERRSAELKMMVEALGNSVGNRVGEIVIKALSRMT